MVHPTWNLTVDNSALVLMPCPGTKEADLLSSLEQLKAENVTVIVTAINQQEMEGKGVAELGALTEQLGMRWIHLPIEDDCAPDAQFEQAWPQASEQIANAMQQGQKVAMHCMGGSGRTGLLAGRFLLDQGWALDDIMAQVQALRPGAFQKSVQIDYIKQVNRV